MKSTLAFGQKRWLGTGPIRPLAQAVYAATVWAELAAVRMVEAFASNPSEPDLGQLTAVIKTFERPRALRRLVQSLRRRYRQLNIIVVDDSAQPLALKGVQTITLPFNSGVSAGRNAGLEAVTTPLVMMLDDDFVFTRRTRLDLPLATLEACPGIDLIAGVVRDLPLFRWKPRQAQTWPGQAEPLAPLGSQLAGLPVVAKVPNFWIARTDKVRQVGWDPAIKRIDHAEFFARALGKLVCVQDHRWSVLHAKTPFDRAYMRYRNDIEADRAYIARKWARRPEQTTNQAAPGPGRTKHDRS